MLRFTVSVIQLLSFVLYKLSELLVYQLGIFHVAIIGLRLRVETAAKATAVTSSYQYATLYENKVVD